MTLKITKIEDIRYRIQNLQYEIENIKNLRYHNLDVWDKGYHTGRQIELEGQLRFLEGLLSG